MSAKSQQTSISLKVGGAKVLMAPSPSTKGFAYKLFAPVSPYPAWQIELKKNNAFGNRKSFIGGVSLIPTFAELTLNGENIRSGYDRSLRVTYYSFQIYAGIDICLRPKAAPTYKNYFSITSGVSFNIRSNMKDPNILNDGGITTNGEIFEGGEYTLENSKLFSPGFFTGLRYHITNSKGIEVLSIELQSSYGIGKYFSHTLRYKVDGNDRVDHLAEKGFQIQLNVIIPLFKFKNKKKQ
jgi:hypothetical protein